ncbi:MAG: kelch repeat-containing protein [Planctomycetota bacterium]
MRVSASVSVRVSRTSGRLLVLATLLGTSAASLRAQQYARCDFLGERRRAGLAYDAQRERMVLFGGVTGRGTTYAPAIQNETWEWSNGVWTARRDVTAQPTLFDGARGTVWDTRDQVVRMVGSPAAGWGLDVWTWKGVGWQRASVSWSPPFRQHFATAYDETRQRLVMWGGTDSTGFALVDVWEFDGTIWTVAAAPNPVGRDEAAMAYDGVRGKVVMFGGRAANGGQALADMWEWDGAVWTQIVPAGLPPARNGHSMTWDPVRRRVVLFGGSTSTPGTTFGDTWEWNGSAWAQVTTAAAPPARTEHAATYHSGRNRVVVACGETATGLLKDTWEYDGLAWVEVTPQAAPDGLANHASAFDSARNDVVVFGGRDNGLALRNDTWRWHLDAWSRANPANSPSARFDHSMAFDRAAGLVVLFGGFTTAAQNDTWLWDGITWGQATPTSSPPARSQHAMAYDSGRGRVVLFGGTSATGSLLADTWEWDGTNWTQITPAASPPARADHGMAYDAGRAQVVLVGGRDATSYRQDTWVYDGTTWTDMSTLNVTPRAGVAMDYDPVRDRVIMFGGSNASSHASPPLYAWNGTQWSIVTVITIPQPTLRSDLSMSWDDVSGHLVAFGGETGNGTSAVRSSETWIITHNTRASAVGLLPASVCQGPNPARIGQYGVPYVGNASFALDFVPGTPLTTPSPVAFLLSLNQANRVMLGPCPLIVDPATLFLTTSRLAAGTVASQPLPIPLAFHLMGLRFLAQCVHLDPPTANNGIAFSAALRVTIGDF